MACIQTREATITTLRVEIKALTVGRKQVTMGLFRQLENEPLIDLESGDLRGIPWGRVNYFPWDCNRPGHLHVVWQKQDELRRACINENPPEGHQWQACNLDRLNWLGTMAPCLSSEYVLRYSSAHDCECCQDKDHHYHLHVSGTDLVFREIDLSKLVVEVSYLDLAKAADRHVRRFDQKKLTESLNNSVGFLAPKWRALLNRSLPDWGAWEARRTCEKQRNEFFTKWRTHYSEFLDLDQLFIAV